MNKNQLIEEFESKFGFGAYLDSRVNLGEVHEWLNIAIDEYTNEILALRQKEMPENTLIFVMEWFYKLSIGQATQGEVADAIEDLIKSRIQN